MAADDYFAPALTGAGTGAATGFALGGGPVGAGIGAAVGLAGGLFQGSANAKRKKALAKARKEMQELQRKQYAQRMADLERVMGFFKPVNNKVRELYGQDAAVDYTPPDRMY